MLRYSSKLPSLMSGTVGNLQKHLLAVFRCLIAPFDGLCCVL